MRWCVKVSLQEIHNGREFISHLNSHLARATSLLLFIFMASSIQGMSANRSCDSVAMPTPTPVAVYSFYNIDESAYPLAGVLGLLASLQWISVLCLPLIQVTHT